MSGFRELLLLRHAHALAPEAAQDDASRALSETGRAEAEAAAAFLADQARPARVLCSPALRTRQTAEIVLEHLGYIDTRHEARIYEATAGELIDVLEDHADAGPLLLVGHNPGLESLVALLATGRSGECRGMPPASIALLRVPASGPIEPGSAELVAFWSP